MRAWTVSWLFIFSSAVPCWAALGQTVDSVVSDQRRLHGATRTVQGDGYSLHEISSADGTLVSEYVSAAGLVFAVSWRGPVAPDLSWLLGSCFPALQDAARSSVHRRGPLVVRTRDLVVETGGHMRAFRGRAFLPGALPVGLAEATVR